MTYLWIDPCRSSDNRLIKNSILSLLVRCSHDGLDKQRARSSFPVVRRAKEISQITEAIYGNDGSDDKERDGRDGEDDHPEECAGCHVISSGLRALAQTETVDIFDLLDAPRPTIQHAIPVPPCIPVENSDTPTIYNSGFVPAQLSFWETLEQAA
jgi:hypothetical protein